MPVEGKKQFFSYALWVCVEHIIHTVGSSAVDAL